MDIWPLMPHLTAREQQAGVEQRLAPGGGTGAPSSPQPSLFSIVAHPASIAGFVL